MSRINPLQMLVLVLEAARDRLLALQVKREAEAQCDLAAAEADTTARAYFRLTDGDLGHARSHLAFARDFAAEAWDRIDASSAPVAEVEDSLARARHNARRALAHLELFTASHVEAIAVRTREADHRAWHLRLSAFTLDHPVENPFPQSALAGWAVADATTVCVRCGDTRSAGDAVYDWDNRRFCSMLCFRSEQQDEGAAWYADYRDNNHSMSPHVLAAIRASPSLRTGLCRVCGAPVFDDRFIRTTEDGVRLVYCATECAAEAAQTEIDQTEDDRHELDEREVADLYLAESGEVDLDECPF